MDLKDQIKEIVRKMLGEESVSGDIGVGAGPISTPNWVAPKGQKKNRATKYAEKLGYKVVKGMPKNSKILDYKELWKSKHSALNEAEISVPEDIAADLDKNNLTLNDLFKAAKKTDRAKLEYKTKEWIQQTLLPQIKSQAGTKINESEEESEKAVKQLKPLLAHTIKHNKLEGTFDKWLEKVKASDDEILDKMWDLAGSAVDRHAINVLSKPKSTNESIEKIVKSKLLNEVSYGKFKKDISYRSKTEILHKGIKEVKRKIQEIDRIVEYTSRMKQELSEGDAVQYWTRTEAQLQQISEMVNNLNEKINKLK